MPIFDALDEAMQLVQEGVFGDTFAYQPMMRPASNGNAAPVADTARSAATVTAILTIKQEKPQQTHTYDPRADRRPGASLAEILIEVDGRFGLTIRPDDTFTRLVGDAGMDSYRVHKTDVTDTGRTIATVNLIKAAG